ncbi:DUF2726 domain-containing protein [Actomonas aquatica]|uniref:DUF2726 domain-containing protein n=1 Tax=Actomonas aquatica TaxID=2866162 RepID=A0ABZ1CB20_9BACT|nr:DUF2726 domain-containing protein [Opitutus sp. WL0086]WRQ88418.1 DUF2726 domain-containing protein [Opitutus sp. WL0086]
MNTTPILLLAVVVAVVLVAFAAVALKSKVGEPKADAALYTLRPSIYSPAERSFLGVLDLIELGELTISSKVRLADIFEVKPGVDRRERQGAVNRITSKHVDFLLIQKSDGKPILGIELDDKSHQRGARVKRDEFVDTTFKSAGLPLLRVKVQATYDPRLVLSEIEKALIPSAPTSPDTQNV